MHIRLFLILFTTFALFDISSAHAQSATLTGPVRTGMTEGHTYPLEWSSDGLKSINLLAYGTRTPLGEKSRGEFQIVIATGVPAEQNSFDWTVPWIDSKAFSLKIKGYDESGKLVANDIKEYEFRPATMAHRLQDGIYLDLSSKENQRLYVQRDRRITRAYFTTSSDNFYWRPRGSHPKQPHDHAGVFKVLSKTPYHWSTLYDVPMRFAMRYYSGHYVHATSNNLYDELGEPASHGCNRMTLHDARELYRMTPIGFRVEVIGPEG